MLSTFGLCKRLVVVGCVGTGSFALLGVVQGWKETARVHGSYLVLQTNQIPPFISTHFCGIARPFQTVTFTESGKYVK